MRKRESMDSIEISSSMFFQRMRKRALACPCLCGRLCGASSSDSSSYVCIERGGLRARSVGGERKGQTPGGMTEADLLSDCGRDSYSLRLCSQDFGDGE